MQESGCFFLEDGINYDKLLRVSYTLVYGTKDQSPIPVLRVGLVDLPGVRVVRNKS